MSDEQLLRELLELRGVEDVESLLKIDTEDAEYSWDAYQFNNMERGLDLLWNHLDAKDSHIHLLFDVDVDGLTSGAIYYQWHVNRYPDVPITYDCNEGKKHGLNEDVVSRIPEGTTLMVIPDSSSSDVKWHKIIHDMGIDIIILDHHEFDTTEETPAVIINCMDGQYPNQSLTGAGVVYKFLERYELDLDVDEPYVRKLLNLVALGQLADLADVRNLETRYLCMQGVKEFTKGNLLLDEIVKQNEYSMKGQCNFTSIGWYVAPLMNAFFREGTREDRMDLFEALCNFERECVHIPKRKTKDNPDKLPVNESLQQNVIRRGKSIKTQQDNNNNYNYIKKKD